MMTAAWLSLIVFGPIILGGLIDMLTRPVPEAKKSPCDNCGTLGTVADNRFDYMCVHCA
jgi:hypothetical protein